MLEKVKKMARIRFVRHARIKLSGIQEFAFQVNSPNGLLGLTHVDPNDLYKTNRAFVNAFNRGKQKALDAQK